MRPIAPSRSTFCAVRAARRISLRRILRDRCRCWKSRTDATSPSPMPFSGTSPAALRWHRSRGSRGALQWMFFEQHALEPNIGAAYFWLALVKGGRDLQTHALEDWMERGYAALQVMENHLKTHDYFATGQLTVADIALYGYTHVAERCDYDLATFPAIRAWLHRIEQTPSFVSMDWRPEADIDESASIAAEA